MCRRVSRYELVSLCCDVVMPEVLFPFTDALALPGTSRTSGEEGENAREEGGGALGRSTWYKGKP